MRNSSNGSIQKPELISRMANKSLPISRVTTHLRHLRGAAAWNVKKLRVSASQWPRMRMRIALLNSCVQTETLRGKRVTKDKLDKTAFKLKSGNTIHHQTAFISDGAVVVGEEAEEDRSPPQRSSSVRKHAKFESGRSGRKSSRRSSQVGRISGTSAWFQH